MEEVEERAFTPVAADRQEPANDLFAPPAVAY